MDQWLKHQVLMDQWLNTEDLIVSGVNYEANLNMENTFFVLFCFSTRLLGFIRGHRLISGRQTQRGVDGFFSSQGIESEKLG
jgi:hypothetical protein